MKALGNGVMALPGTSPTGWTSFLKKYLGRNNATCTRTNGGETVTSLAVTRTNTQDQGPGDKNLALVLFHLFAPCHKISMRAASICEKLSS